MQTETMKVTGMTCGGCVSNVTEALLAVPGVSSATVSLSDGAAEVQFDAAKTSVAQIKSAVAASGYGTENAASVKGGCCG